MVNSWSTLVLNLSKEKCIHSPAERQFNVVNHKITFEKFECTRLYLMCCYSVTL